MERHSVTELWKKGSPEMQAVTFSGADLVLCERQA